MDSVFAWLKVDSYLEFWWVAFGLFGQLLFTGRFLVQWIASERAKRSVVPIAFWYFSISGGIILLAYAIYRQDPVFILGQSMGLFIYLRNLWLIRVERRLDT
ncbi:lipid-A-disaccharide synthase N-terminal domain-containing protein [Cognatishimia sp. MH4019]|uniref:lipid-A-disaccharide synthase N-terminal domain-containing protein n=1 Tax=Cognatishimia sp. MH4019 TaxID=2854030 RepID=UPI001CD6D094|nr:lipid-A-disaccharide synthase N-terminal domain-containing protein [Cognatishimia sp. MH4019]